MSDKQQVIITCYFKSPEGNFMVRYLVTLPIIPWPDWDDGDERWLTYDDTAEIKEYFKRAYKTTIGSDFDGEIMAVDQSSFVVLEVGHE